MPRYRGAAKVALSVCAALMTGAATGFAAALLRPRPSTRYATSLEQPIAADDHETTR